MPTYHDSIFKLVFSQPEHAAGELRHVLPPELGRQVDWESLELRPGSFVDKRLAQRHTDLLYQARVGNGTALIYFVFEHKSGAPRKVLFQLLRYMVRIWEQFQRSHPPGARLPPIIPVLIRHGATPWRGERRLLDAIDAPGELRQALAGQHLDFEILVDDLAAQSPAQLRSRAMSALGRITLYALKRALQGGDVLDELTRWRRVVRQAAQAPGAQEMLATLILYMMIKIQGMDSDRASQWVGEALGPDTELNMKTLQELLRDELRKKNSRDLRKEISRELRKEIREDLRKEVREAMAAGEAGARVAGQLDVLLAQLRARFETLSPEHERRLRSGTADQLNAWALRVLTAQSIADVLGPDQPA